MKNTLYAVIAACLAMLATSGIVALATAAPADEYPDMTATWIEQKMANDLDMFINQQLKDIQKRLIAQHKAD